MTGTPAPQYADHDELQFILNGKSVPLDPNLATTSLAEYIRSQTHVKSVKISCGSGGCGACTVLLQQHDPATGRLLTRSVNACLTPAFMAVGAQVTSAEGLARDSQGQPVVAERLAAFHASQCGFCTPGFAVACTAALLKHTEQPVSSGKDGLLASAALAAGGGAAAGGPWSGEAGRPLAQALHRALDGNLCRCTGYRPIVDACKSFASDVDLEDLGLHACLRGNPLGPHTASTVPPPPPGPSPPGPRSRAPPAALDLAPEGGLGASAAQLPGGQGRAGQSPRRRRSSAASQGGAAEVPEGEALGAVLQPAQWFKLGRSHSLCVPHTLQQLMQVVAAHAGAVRLVAGNTGAGVYKELWPQATGLLVNITQVPELRVAEAGHRRVTDRGGSARHLQLLRLGASVTLSQAADLMSALAAGQQLPAPGEALAPGAAASSATSGANAHPHFLHASLSLSHLSHPHSPSSHSLSRHSLTPTASGPRPNMAEVVAGNASPASVKPSGSSGIADKIGEMAIDAISEAECQPDGDVGHESLKQDARQGDAREAVPDSKAELAVWAGLAEHISRVAGTHVRNAATVAGNLVLTRGHGLPSDVATLLLATDASVEVADAALGGLAPVSLPLEAFLATRMPHSDGRTASNGEREGAHKAVTLVSERPGATQLVTAVTVPVPETGSRFWSSRVAQRWSNAAAMVNAAFLLRICPSSGKLEHARIFFGMDLEKSAGSEDWRITRCSSTEAALIANYRPPSSASNSDTVTASQSTAPASSAPASSHPAWFNALVVTALTHLQQDLAQTLLPLSTPPPDKSAPAGQHPLSSTRADLLRSVAEGLLLQGLSALLLSPAASAGTGAPSSSGPAGEEGVSGSGGLGWEKGGMSGCHAAKLAAPAVSGGRQQLLEADPRLAPMMQPVIKTGAVQQACGTAQYTDDLPVARGALYAAWVTSSVPLGRVAAVDTCLALQVPGAVRWVGPEDILGENAAARGASHPNPAGEEPLFATEVNYHGQPLGLMLATSASAARRAAAAVHVTYSRLPPAPAPPRAPSTEGQGEGGAEGEGAVAQPVLSIEEGLACGALQPLPRMLPSFKAGTRPQSVGVAAGDVEAGLAAAPHRVEGVELALPSQLPAYMEQQSAVAEVEEDGAVCVSSATQMFDHTLFTVAAVLGLPHHKVNIRCRRLGGGFGGKASHATKVAAAAAVAAVAAGVQVRLVADQAADMALFGGRQQAAVRYSCGWDQEGRLLAVDVQVTLLGGAFMGNTVTDVFGLLAVADSVYRVPAYRMDVAIVRAHLPPRTTVRGPGEALAFVIMESIVEGVAAAVGRDPAAVRRLNMWQPDPQQPHFTNSLGKAVDAAAFSLPRLWEELKAGARYEERRAEVAAWNAAQPWRKRGIALVPCTYSVFVGSRSALVHLYRDGSVLVVAPGVDMGQGLNVKVLQTAAAELAKALPGERAGGVPLHLLRTADQSSFTMPHNSITAGSTASEMACEAVRLACRELVGRLRPLTAALGPDASWQQVVAAAFLPFVGGTSKVPLTAHAHGGLQTNTGPNPFGMQGYHVYGAAVTEVEVDVLTGERRLLASDILFDVGRSVNPAVDLGQVEGAFVFGLGYLLSEAMEHHPTTGAATTTSTWSYKTPGVMDIPTRLNVAMLKDSPMHVKDGPVSSKACGEPPLLLAASALFALQAASRAAASQTFGTAPQPFASLAVPATVAAVKAACGTRPLADLLRPTH